MDVKYLFYLSEINQYKKDIFEHKLVEKMWHSGDKEFSSSTEK